MKRQKIDIGLVWAKGVNIWGQLGTIAGIVNTLMLVGVFYTTTLYPKFPIPFWAYILIVLLAATLCIGFIIKFGISGYYRFLSRRSEISQINERVSLIMKHLDIDDESQGNE